MKQRFTPAFAIFAAAISPIRSMVVVSSPSMIVRKRPMVK
jgi:hypothetical protein